MNSLSYLKNGSSISYPLRELLNENIKWFCLVVKKILSSKCPSMDREVIFYNSPESSLLAKSLGLNQGFIRGGRFSKLGAFEQNTA
jgi:hypothetical protein